MVGIDYMHMLHMLYIRGAAELPNLTLWCSCQITSAVLKLGKARHLDGEHGP